MIDFGFDKIALIGAVALIVIGPEKLPRVARTVGTLIGKAQRYVADVKAEVNRSIELDELKKMKTEFEDAARNVEQSISKEVQATAADFNSSWQTAAAMLPANGGERGATVPSPEYRHPNPPHERKPPEHEHQAARRQRRRPTRICPINLHQPSVGVSVRRVETVAERNLFRAAVTRPAVSTPPEGGPRGNWFPP